MSSPIKLMVHTKLRLAQRGRFGLTTLGGLALVLTLALCLAYWLPSTQVDQQQPDPALIHANSLSTQSEPLKEAYFEHQGLNLHYVSNQARNRETIVFLHGFPSFWYSLSRQIEAFKQGYNVIAIDGLGAGRSDAPTEVAPYKLSNMAAHIIALLDELGIERTHLVGHDWGAGLAFGLSQAYPTRIATVTGISAPPPNVLLAALANDKQQQEVSAYFEVLKSANPITLKLLRASNRVWKGAYQPLVEAGKLSEAEGALFRQASNNSRRINAHINWYRANTPEISAIGDASYWPDRGSRVTRPALFIWSRDDATLYPGIVTKIQQLSDELQILELKDAGHWPHVNAAKLVNAAIKSRLNGS